MDKVAKKETLKSICLYKHMEELKEVQKYAKEGDLTIEWR